MVVDLDQGLQDQYFSQTETPRSKHGTQGQAWTVSFMPDCVSLNG